MNNTILQFKIKERLNKLDSKDYHNLDCFRITEAFNTFQNMWTRELIKRGEFNKQTVEDIQVLLKDEAIVGTNHATYFETTKLPKEAMSISNVYVQGVKDRCPPSPIKATLIEQGNVDTLLKEYVTSPSYEWRETFYTMNGNRLRIYTNDEFKVTDCKLTYYRFPTPISIEGCENEFGQGLLEVPCEFKEDFIEELIKGTCSIIAGDIENFNQVQRETVQ